MGITPVIAGVGAAASAGSAINSIANGSGSGSTQAQANQQGQQAEADKQQALAYWQALQQPTFNSNPYQTESVVGTLNPQTYSPYIGNMTQIQDSPEQQAQQEQAIAQLEQFAKGGLTPTDLASLNQIATSQAGSNSSQDQALQAQMRAAGQGGAGSQYAMEAANNQGTANNANSLYASALQTALQRQLSSINGADTAANNLRTQNVNISGQMAQIANQFNTEVQNLRTAAAANAANVNNAAQAANLTNAQTVANANTGINNQSQNNQNQILQNEFGNQTTQIAGEGSALNGMAQTASANQAALSQQAVGQQNQVTAGLNQLGNLGTTLTGSNAPSWFTNLTGPTAAQQEAGQQDLIASGNTNYGGTGGGGDASATGYITPPIPPDQQQVIP